MFISRSRNDELLAEFISGTAMTIEVEGDCLGHEQFGEFQAASVIPSSSFIQRDAPASASTSAVSRVA
jgi:hypothetical protein